MRYVHFSQDVHSKRERSEDHAVFVTLNNFLLVERQTVSKVVGLPPSLRLNGGHLNYQPGSEAYNDVLMLNTLSCMAGVVYNNRANFSCRPRNRQGAVVFIANDPTGHYRSEQGVEETSKLLGLN